MSNVAHYPIYPTSINVVLLILRLFLGLMILAHGLNKVLRGGKLPGLAGWFHAMGMRPGPLNAVLAAGTEMAVGVLLTTGLVTTLASAGLVGLMVVAIVTVHRKNGFFITNPGGGVEYCLGIIAASLVPGVLGAGRYSLDNLWHPLSWSANTRLIVVLALGVGGAIAQLCAFYRPRRSGE